MSEITPELVAQIASRLLNELPGAAAHPTSPVGVDPFGGPVPATPPPTPPATPASFTPQPMPHAVDPPVAPAAAGLPGVVPHNTPPNLESLLVGLRNVAPSPVGTPTVPAAVPSMPSVAIPPALPASPQADPRNADYAGLRSFVERIRQTGTGRQGSQCTWANEPHAVSNVLKIPAVAPSNSARPFDVVQIRKDFPILHQTVHGKPLVWLDNAATTQKPQSVIDALSDFYRRDNSNIHRAAHTLAARATEAYEGARDKVHRFLGAATSKEIIFVRGTTEGINLVAQTYGHKFLQPGDEIILSTLEHHANIVPWQMIARDRGAVIRVIPVTDRGEIMLEEYQRLLGPRTRIVSLTHASNSLGTILPVEEMTQMAKRYNARVLIDGAQSVAHIPVNVQQLGCDFYVFSGHKIFGPTGIGAVYASSEMQEIMPPWQGGGNMIRNVTFEETTYAEPPARFEAGTPNIADAVGLGAALDYVQRLGLPNIAKYEHELLEYATAELSRIPNLRLIGAARHKVGVLSFVLPNRKTEEVGKLLDQEGIAVRSGHHCAQPSLRRYGVEATVRPSLSLYNTFEEIDRLAAAIRRIQS